MAYIQITTVCNMSCAHCCMSCGKNYKGQHMDNWTYQHALDFCNERGDYIVLGGGEPTMHPHFMKFLAKAINNEQYHNSGMVPWFATNGSKTELTLELMHAADCPEEEFIEKLNMHYCVSWQEELFHMAVSQDSYHDPINDKVTELAKHLDNVEIRNVDGHVAKTGHAKNIYGKNSCVCTILQIKPDGSIYMCGCDNAPLIGDVFNGLIGEIQTCLGDEDFNENFEGCYNTPQTDEAITLIKILNKRHTHQDWVNKHIPVKKSKINHPDTHRVL